MHDLVVTDIEPAFSRNGDPELGAVADHVKGLVAHDGEEADHAQHVGFANENVAANFFVFGDLSFLLATDGGSDVDGGVERADLRRLGGQVIDQLLSAGRLKFGGAGAHLDHARAKQTRGFAEHQGEDGDGGKSGRPRHSDQAGRAETRSISEEVQGSICALRFGAVLQPRRAAALPAHSRRSRFAWAGSGSTLKFRSRRLKPARKQKARTWT